MRRLHLRLTGPTAIVAALAGCAPPIECTLVGCSSSARVMFAPPIAPPYDVVVVLSAERRVVQRATDADGVESNELVLGTVTGAREEVSFRCVDGRVDPPFSDATNGACDERAFDLPDTAAHVDVTITSTAGEVTGSGDVRYAPVFPNGEECGAACFTGAVEVGASG